MTDFGLGKTAKGKHLDRLGETYGLKRKRWLWVFRESDVSFRHRLLLWVLAWHRRPLEEFKSLR